MSYAGEEKGNEGGERFKKCKIRKKKFKQLLAFM